MIYHLFVFVWKTMFSFLSIIYFCLGTNMPVFYFSLFLMIMILMCVCTINRYCYVSSELFVLLCYMIKFIFSSFNKYDTIQNNFKINMHSFTRYAEIVYNFIKNELNVFIIILSRMKYDYG